ncbi:MAG TPA: DUF1800 domain-containing protein [Dehalococcoidia bacterium]|nr:DUF1800 domain-containing protein [Dehalococcoidia bacterium]
MELDAPVAKPLLSRKATRRAIVGGAASATALAALYALGGRSLFPSEAREGSGTAASADEGDALQREEVRISHLLRRAGFGVTKQEYDRYQSLGLDRTLSELLDFKAVDDSEAEALAGRIDLTGGNVGAPLAWWLTRIANTKRPLQEKMTLFWHGLLTSQVSVVRDPAAMIAQNEFFRANAFANFGDVLKGVTRDPAMMVYLDIAGSVRAAPNENYARELMELFSLGVGNFSEQDVREAARAFTGWRIPRQRGDNGRPTLLEPVFISRLYDNGTKIFFGQAGTFGPDEIIDIILEQPASASFIVRRLFAYFVYPDPSEADVAPFVAAYHESDGNIGAVVEAILRSEIFYSPRAYRAIVKSPVEYAVGALKAVGLEASAAPTLLGGGRRDGGALGAMGQLPLEPPNVAGWPGGSSWLNSTTLFARLNFIHQVTSAAATDRRSPAAAPRPAQDLGTVSQALDYYLPFLLDGNVSPEAQAVLAEFAGGADVALTPERFRGLVYLVLGAPQFHLA